MDDREIKCIVISTQFPGDDGLSWCVGHQGVTRIEEIIKSGMSSDIPYLRIWKGDHVMAEFCQHHIVGVYFKEPPHG